ncbi:preprotein translocase subunit SecE [Schaalia cardiffensis]|uniref:preprotein translocase subunit SecE n=1 Tax=Schaalia cardiffensis TaxID=181487 RepID=UPI0023F5672E|nr:preprotein translocase subunit SecE [Schaalia cardiffensis]
MAHTMAGDVSGPADRTKSGPTRARDAAPKESQKKPNIFRRIWVFITQVIAEMKKVTYPTGEETQTYFVVVIVFVAAIMAFTGLLDLGFGKLNALIFG